MTFWKAVSRTISRTLAASATHTLIRRIGDGRDAIEIHEDDQHRWLRFGVGAIQSRIALGEPERLALPYTVGMAAPLLFRPRFEHILMLGLGGGSLLSFYHRLLPECRFTVVEPSATMVRVAKRYFDAPIDDARVEVLMGDARERLADCVARHDLLMLDIFDARGLPPWVLSAEFCRDCHRALVPGGMLLANLWIDGPRRGEDPVAVLRGEYSGDTLEFNPADSTNLVLLGFDALPGPLFLDTAAARGRSLREQTGLDTADLLARIAAQNQDRPDVLAASASQR